MHDVFLSPQLSLRNKAKEKVLPPKSKFRQKPEIPRKHGKSQEGMGNPGKAWEILARHRKSRESMENPGNTGDTRNSGKGREIPAREVLLKPGKFGLFF